MNPWNNADWPAISVRKRDSYRARCYRAEAVAFEHPKNVGFEGIAGARKYLAKIYRDPTWTRLGLPECCPNVMSSPKAYSFAYGMTRPGVPGDIYMHWGQLQPILFLHELAHATIPSGHGHDARWQAAYVVLVGNFMGPDVAEILISNFARM